MADVPSRIAELVETFERNIETYKKQPYNEAQVRREFIDPFFEELGWDVTNKNLWAPAYREVIHEDAIKIGGATEAPDYCFRIGGVRKFFVEAKKPSVDIKDDVHPAYKLRRYAWSAKLPLSIVTDFEEFAVYDCQIRPKQTDRASTARIRYLIYKDYIKKWNEIADVFSKDAILKGSFDKFAAETKGKRGTTTVDKEFLAELEKWRKELARVIALKNTKLSVDEINFAVQRTIDRILFLRMCEDRGIENYGQLLGLSTGREAYQRLCQVFRQADAKYNSGLFHFHKEKGRPDPDELTPNITIDDTPLKYILHSLYYPQCPYEFSVLPAEILGNVYEQFLGKVIRLTPAHFAKIEEKPEVKKAGGVYYTPAYIVDYIVKNTVGKLCEGKTPKEISELRILDPACGSGSFLLGAYTYLLDYHRDWYVEHDPKKHTKQIYQGKGGQWFLTIAEKKQILLKNIFGVDIDTQAVEVTKLSLLLKVLEGETSETIGQTYRMFHERALPDLANNIKCGNSLIGPDFYGDKDPDSVTDDLRKKINAFDWQAEFPDIMKSGGFHAVIGNPPYGAQFDDLIMEYLKSHYQACVWRGESYLLFIEQAITLLSKGGIFGYIIPDTYLNLGFTQALRTLLLQNTVLREVVSLPAIVFPSTTVDTTLLFFEKTDTAQTYHPNNVLVKTFAKKRKISAISDPDNCFSISTKLWYDHNAFLVHSSPTEIAIVSKTQSTHHPLSDYADILYGIKVYQVSKGKPPQTEKVREAKPFTSKKQDDSTFSPMFDGKHIGRYSLLWNNDNWVKYGPWLAEPRNPEKYSGEKLLIRKIVGQTLIATYFPRTSYCNTLAYVAKLKHQTELTYFYLLAILNSRFIGWFFRNKFQISDADTFPQILIRDMLNIPLPLPPKSIKDKLEKLVHRMLDLHKKLAAAKVPAEKTRIQRQINNTDKKIDKLVYELYDLTEEEIKIVEEG